ncbi:TlpA disulfide reductase family protein [Microbulbifer sp. THAF38]|uniref:TlpA family protein disulfide reductase n=1 Tax=Microbulbifer sp. THAF38 TaxID=2587856 RepID=UPI0012A8997B|nr:TlpA disulfide reductase family protein [Microbulbifer sp. THAF38]QFT55755.1 Thiol-disulfide oxidoreductase ResA [Microbulbifer sp. THAF38]
MKKILGAISLSLVSAISGCDNNSRLHTTGGESVNTEGKTILINYWAEWCKPCREEVPVLNELAQANDDVIVLGVNFDGLPSPAAIEQAKKLGIEFPLLTEEPEGRWGQPWPEVLPTTFIIGRDGRWQKTLVGPQTAEDLSAALQ